MQQKTGIEQALEMFNNSPTKLANAIGGAVLRQHVEHWLRAKRVPADKAPDVELATGIPCEVLCPDVNWGVLRASSKQPQQVGPVSIAQAATETVAEGAVNAHQ